jgi:hypothetical protein
LLVGGKFIQIIQTIPTVNKLHNVTYFYYQC